MGENDICQGCQHRGNRSRCYLSDCPVHGCWYVRDSSAQTRSTTAIDMEILAVIRAMVMDGEEPSDFALSFPLVRRVWDLASKPKPN